MSEELTPQNETRTLQCKEYFRLYMIWIRNPKDIDAEIKLKSHHNACPQCRARMAQMNELARNAEHPEAIK